MIDFLNWLEANGLFDLDEMQDVYADLLRLREMSLEMDDKRMAQQYRELTRKLKKLAGNFRAQITSIQRQAQYLYSERAEEYHGQAREYVEYLRNGGKPHNRFGVEARIIEIRHHERWDL